MSSMKPVTVVYPPLMHLLFSFCAVVLGLMGVIGWLAYSQEGWAGGPWLMAVFWPLGLGCLLAVLLAPRRVVFADDQMTVQRWLLPVTLNVMDVTAVANQRFFIRITGRGQTVHLARINAQVDALLVRTMTQFIPVLQRQQQDWRTAPLPFTLRPRRMTPLIMLGLGLAMLATVGALVVYMVQDSATFTTSDWVFVPGFGLLCALIGLFALKLTLWDFVYVYRFTADALEWRSVLRVQRFDPRQLRDVVLREGEVRVRGVVHPRHWLALVFADGTTLELAPDDISLVLDMATAENELNLLDLAARLRNCYLRG